MHPLRGYASRLLAACLARQSSLTAMVLVLDLADHLQLELHAVRNRCDKEATPDSKPEAKAALVASAAKTPEVELVPIEPSLELVE